MKPMIQMLARAVSSPGCWCFGLQKVLTWKRSLKWTFTGVQSTKVPEVRAPEVFHARDGFYQRSRPAQHLPCARKMGCGIEWQRERE